ncbi:hypothetical protein [Kribbella monticola]|uniref:hypothetical protein n=1 Tax=Kribbella monticola TaxID=2185285 RepID=UPI000DD3AACC|nr:hypothetical protein [Kribbella monticola]
MRSFRSNTLQRAPQGAARRIAAVVVTALLTAVPVTISQVVTAAPASALSCSGVGLPSITRDHVMARANTWLTRHVPYNQGSCYTDAEYAGKSYRQDCSGYVSMAWGLSTSLVVSQFPSYATKLASRADLQPGDALISPDGTSHMVLFAGWKDSSHTTFTVWHEANTARGTVTDSSGSWLNGYTSWRYNRITSSPQVETVDNGGGTRMIGSAAYMDVSRLGQVYAWNSRYLGGSPALGADHITDAKVTTGDNGYWLLSQTGNIYAYGNAPYLGGGGSGHTGDLVALAATPSGQGYAMVSASGQVYAYGDAGYYGGSPTGYGAPFVDIEMTPSGHGYWLLTSLGQVYAYGDATYYGGSPTGFSRAIVAMSPTPTGLGYVLVSKAGQVYAYGDAQYKGGSPAGISSEISDISHTPGSGYVMVSKTGQHYAYGDAPFIGNPTGAADF